MASAVRAVLDHDRRAFDRRRREHDIEPRHGIVPPLQQHLAIDAHDDRLRGVGQNREAKAPLEPERFAAELGERRAPVVADARRNAISKETQELLVVQGGGGVARNRRTPRLLTGNHGRENPVGRSLQQVCWRTAAARRPTGRLRPKQ